MTRRTLKWHLNALNALLEDFVWQDLQPQVPIVLLDYSVPLAQSQEYLILILEVPT
jgi:hypothetical protein